MSSELNALVAEKVMGWSKSKVDDTLNYEVPRYSTFISCAWLVVEEMRERGFMIDLDDIGHEGNKSKAQWNCVFFTRETMRDVGPVNCDTAPEAICRAGLEAIK